MLLNKAYGLNFSQSEVDFVIPNLDKDLPLCIDPFLLYKSRDDSLNSLHLKILSIFNNSIRLFRDGKRAEMDEIINFPEANEIGFGYTEKGSNGSGLGDQLNKLLADTLAASEELQDRGLRHIEELQLVSLGIAADRISDVAANILKIFLVQYTQKQAEIWKIPLTTALPVNHYFDFDDYEWKDSYFDLPRNTLTGSPILLVPRRIVRLLPWINIDDYAATDYKLFLRASNKKGWSKFSGSRQVKSINRNKIEICNVTRANITLLDKYITRKEKESSEALPVYIGQGDLGLPDKPLAEEFIKRLKSLPVGVQYAKDYQRLIYEILNYLFEPELTNGEMEVRTIDGTERRDIIYTNESDTSFWEYIRHSYDSPLVMFEVKNVQNLEIEHINQVSSYLGARLGMLGFIITRHSTPENIICKTYSIYNDTPSMPRKIILTVNDEDLTIMLRNRDTGQNPTPTQVIQNKYRIFRTSVQ